MWIWQQPDWPDFRHDAEVLSPLLATAAHAIGRLHGKVSALQAPDRDRAALAALVADVVKTSAIEGERLDVATVRSSLARRLGVDVDQAPKADRHVEGVIEMTLDATEGAARAVTAERLKDWQAALFPTGRSGLRAVRVGEWRDDRDGPMQVVSGPHGRQTIHFEAPPAAALEDGIAALVAWLDATPRVHPILQAGIAHLWLVTLHPFEDGNGRVSRTLGDLLLSRFDGVPYRCYSVSAQMQAEHGDYYARLEASQRGGMDVSPWLAWFLGCLERAVLRSEAELARVLVKSLFWQRIAKIPLGDRQVKGLNKVLDEFAQTITNRKWAALTRVSADTALRDLRRLVELEVLEPLPGGGRSAAYWLKGVPLPGAA